ncbi:MAG: tetratricopeptide repeat protein, partial [Bacteroidota bacterium]
AAGGAARVLLAHQPVGRKIDRFVDLGRDRPAVEFSTLVDNEESVAISRASIAVILSEQGKFSKSLEMYQEALLFFERQGNPNMLANIYNNIANIYQQRDEFDKAYEYYNRTNQYDSITGNKSGRSRTVQNMGNVLVQLGQNDDARKNYLLAIDLAVSSGSECAGTMPMTQLGDLYLDEGAYDSAYYYINRALNLALKCEHERSIASVYLDLGDYHRIQGDFRKAEDALLKGFETAERNDMRPNMQELASSLYEVYELLGNYPYAYKFLKISSELQDELFDKESTEAIARLEAEYEFEKEKQTIESEQAQKELAYQQELTQEKWIRYSVIALTIAIAIVAFMAYRGYKIKQGANVALQDKNQKLNELRANEKRLSDEAIASKERELATMAMASHEKNALLKDLEQKVSFIEGRMGDEMSLSLKEMRKTISDGYSLDQSWDSFLHRFEDVHPQFFDRLKEENPNLTIDDLKLSAYLKIGMTNKEIANVTHLAIGSVKSKINRLKKKLEMGPDDSVRDFMLRYA